MFFFAPPLPWGPVLLWRFSRGEDFSFIQCAGCDDNRRSYKSGFRFACMHDCIDRHGELACERSYAVDIEKGLLDRRAVEDRSQNDCFKALCAVSGIPALLSLGAGGVSLIKSTAPHSPTHPHTASRARVRECWRDDSVRPLRRSPTLLVS